MLALRSLVVILIATLFVAGGTARAMPMQAAQPPCHEAPGDHGKSVPVQAAMTCCIGCMPAPTDATVIPTRVAARPAVFGRATLQPEGRLTAPDPHPPRLRV